MSNLRDSQRGIGQVVSLRTGVRIVEAGPLSSDDLFTLLWSALADVLGTAAAAALLRRSAQRAAPRFPELAELAITRASLEYHYKVPAAWKDPAPAQALCELVRELWKLLVDMTGSVVVDRLLKIPKLRESGVFPSQPEEST